MFRSSFLVVVLVCGCTRAPAKHDGITIGITQEPDTLWMPMKQMNASEHVGRPGALLLTVFDDEKRLVPQAAVDIPTLKNGGVVLEKDGTMRVTWKLRDGLFWADGVPVTTDDFVFGDELCRARDLEIVDRTVCDRVTAMTAPDPRTLVVTFGAPYAYYAAVRNHEALPRHLVEPIWKAKGRALKEDVFGTKPVLGGAFTVGEWVPGASVTLVRNPFAVALKPKLDRITWRIIPNTTTLEANLLSGSIDAISVIGLTFDQALALQKRLPDRFEMRFTDALNYEHIELNLDNPILADKRVREALLYAIDKEALSAQLFEGKQPAAYSNEPPSSRFHNANAPKRAYEHQKAAALLDDAGWRADPAGGARVKDKKPLRLSIVTTAGDKTRELVEEIMVAAWKKVGIDVVVQNQPAKVMFGDTVRHRKFDGMAMLTWTRDPLQINEALWRCDQIPSAQNGWRGMNYPGYCNPKVDALLAQMTGELDDDKRDALGREVIAILDEDLPTLPLYFRKDVSVIPKGFQGWRPPGVLQSMAWNAQEWAWPP